MNLIICCTPFQVLLAEKIIEMHPDEEFHGLLIQSGNSKNNKYNYYYKKLEEKCNSSEYLIFDRRNYISILFSLVYMRIKFFFLPKIDKVFLANIQTDILFMLLSGLKAIDIFTFDDGIGSLISNDRYLHIKSYSFLKKIVYKCLFNKYSSIRIIENSKRHFTIYEGMENFKGKLEYIKLIPSKYYIGENLVFKDYKSILLGQPIYEAVKGKDIKNNIVLAESIIKKFNIDYYFPHPREDYVIPDVCYINNQLVFEDYILRSIDDNPDIQYVIYTFMSGAAFNLVNIPNIKIICIKPNDLDDFWSEVYLLFSNVNNVSWIEWDVVNKEVI